MDGWKTDRFLLGVGLFSGAKMLLVSGRVNVVIDDKDGRFGGSLQWMPKDVGKSSAVFFLSEVI